MNITQQVRDYAAQNPTAADDVERGLREKADEFRSNGGEIYVSASTAPGAPDIV